MSEANKANKLINGFHHVAIRVKDFEATLRFYTEGLEMLAGAVWGEDDNRGVMLDCGNGNAIEVFSGGSVEEKPEGTWLHIALKTDDCDRALEKAHAAGAEVTMNPKDIVEVEALGKIRIAFCKGLNGEVIEFFQQA